MHEHLRLACGAELLRVHGEGPRGAHRLFLDWCKERGIDRADRMSRGRCSNAISGTCSTTARRTASR